MNDPANVKDVSTMTIVHRGGRGDCDVPRDGIANFRVIPVLINDHHEPVPVRVDGDGQKVAWFLEYLSEGLNTKFVNRGDHFELLA